MSFKPVVPNADGGLKGNVDADLVLRTVAGADEYDKAVIVSNDGDFYSLVGHLHDRCKLEAVISPNARYCSGLLRQAAGGRIYYMDDLRHKLERRK